MDVRRVHPGLIASALLIMTGSGCGEEKNAGNGANPVTLPVPTAPVAVPGGVANGAAGTGATPDATGMSTNAIGDMGAAGAAGTGAAPPPAAPATPAAMGEPSEPSWLAIYDNVFVRAGCNGPGLCHGGAAGMFQMLDPQGTYAALVGVAAGGEDLTGATMSCKDSGMMRVAPGAPDQSLLMTKLEGTQSCGAPMPPVGGLLTDDERAQVRAWILQGALDN